MFIYIIFLLIVLFLYVILNQHFLKKSINVDIYDAYNTSQFNPDYYFKKGSNLGYSIFNNGTIIEGNQNNNSSANPSPQELESQIQDLSTNLYQIGNQINQLAQQQNAPSQLPSTPPTITGTS